MRLLVAFDDSDGARLAFEKATTIAKPTDDIYVVFVVNTPTVLPITDLEYAAVLPQVDNSRVMTSAEERLKKCALQCRELSLHCWTEVKEGEPRGILKKLVKKWQIDLLVCGSRGMGSMGKILLGSVSEYLVHNCTCSILVVKNESKKVK